MGLDMYLSKHVYVKNWDHHTPSQRHTITVMKGGKPRTDIDTSKISYLVLEVAYWRKANMIHGWFVKNVQDGQDDCRPYYVSSEKLQELLNTVTEVLASIRLVRGKVVNGYTFDKQGNEVPCLEEGRLIKDTSRCEELLPVTSGFFFGGKQYNQWYYEDLKYTKDVLTEALKKGNDNGDFYYQSSW